MTEEANMQATSLEDSPDLSCAVCLTRFGLHQPRRPIDLGCGWSHSYCEQCILQSPATFRRCPECRSPALNPHINFALLRVLSSLATAPQEPVQGANHLIHAAEQAVAVQAGNQVQTSRHGTRNRNPGSMGHRAGHADAMPSSPALAALQAEISGQGRGLFRHRGTAGEPQGFGLGLGSMFQANGLPAQGQSHPRVMAGPDGNEPLSPDDQQLVRSAMDELPVTLQQVRSSFWAWAGPLLGLVYLLSPLDIIPDFLPLLGWLDDLLVLGAVLYWVYTCVRRMQVAQRSSAQHHYQEWDLPHQAHM